MEPHPHPHPQTPRPAKHIQAVHLSQLGTFPPAKHDNPTSTVSIPDIDSDDDTKSFPLGGS